MSTTLITFILILVILLIIIVYVIVLFETAKNRTFIFAPYNPEPTFPSFRPFGAVIELTAEEIAQRQALIANALGNN